MTVEVDANGCTATLAPATIVATATDICGVSIGNSYNANGADASDTFPLGDTSITFTATDGNALTSQCKLR